jgi:hypothetical protein
MSDEDVSALSILFIFLVVGLLVLVGLMLSTGGGGLNETKISGEVVNNNLNLKLEDYYHLNKMENVLLILKDGKKVDDFFSIYDTSTVNLNRNDSTNVTVVHDPTETVLWSKDIETVKMLKEKDSDRRFVGRVENISLDEEIDNVDWDLGKGIELVNKSGSGSIKVKYLNVSSDSFVEANFVKNNLSYRKIFSFKIIDDVGEPDTVTNLSEYDIKVLESGSFQGGYNGSGYYNGSKKIRISGNYSNTILDVNSNNTKILDSSVKDDYIRIRYRTNSSYNIEWTLIGFK